MTMLTRSDTVAVLREYESDPQIQVAVLPQTANSRPRTPGWRRLR